MGGKPNQTKQKPHPPTKQKTPHPTSKQTNKQDTHNFSISFTENLYSLGINKNTNQTNKQTKKPDQKILNSLTCVPHRSEELIQYSHTITPVPTQEKWLHIYH